MPEHMPPTEHMPREKHNSKITWTPVFVSALFTVAGTWKQRKSTEEWISGTYYNGIFAV